MAIKFLLQMWPPPLTLPSSQKMASSTCRWIQHMKNWSILWSRKKSNSKLQKKASRNRLVENISLMSLKKSKLLMVRCSSMTSVLSKLLRKSWKRSPMRSWSNMKSVAKMLTLQVAERTSARSLYEVSFRCYVMTGVSQSPNFRRNYSNLRKSWLTQLKI